MAGVRALVVDHWVKSLQELKISNIPEPHPGNGEVSVEVKACGCNFFDALMVQGKYQFKPPFPFVPGAELAGIVKRVGEGVSRFKPGDRVFASVAHGAFTEVAVVAAAQLMTVPPTMSFEEAAGFGMVYATSYLGLVDRGRLQRGETVLVHAAAGGVGLAAVQIAKALGARVIGTAGSATKCQVVRDAGADLCINYNERKGKQWVQDVMEFTDGKGADIVYDPVGGDIFDLSIRCLAWKTGRLLVVGFAGGRIPTIAANRILLKNIAVIGVFLGSHTMREPQALPRIMGALQDLHSRGLIKPKIYERIFVLDEINEALETITSRRSYGKVIVTPGSRQRSRL